MKKIFTVILAFSAFKMAAQIPAAAIFQAPLLVHPGLAGNTGKNRIALLANQNDYYVPVTKEPMPFNELGQKLSYRTVFENTLNVYGSYDLLLKGFGLGVFATYYSVPESAGTTAPFREEFSTFHAGGYSFGAIVSPKLIIPGKYPSLSPRFTIAPSLAITYKSGKEYSGLIIPESDFSTLIPTKIIKDLKLNQLTAEPGVIVNSKRGYAGYSLSLLYDFSQEFQQAVRERTDLTKNFRSSHLLMQHTVCLGMVFPKREGSLFSFTPLTVAGLSNNLAGNRKEESISQAHLQTGINWAGYLHQSLNFRLKWFLFGGSYTEFRNQRIAAYHAGFKTRYFRFTAFYSFRKNNTRKMEAALNFTF